MEDNKEQQTEEETEVILKKEAHRDKWIFRVLTAIWEAVTYFFS